MDGIVRTERPGEEPTMMWGVRPRVGLPVVITMGRLLALFSSDRGSMGVRRTFEEGWEVRR